MVQQIHYNQVNEAMSCRKSVTTPKVSMCGTMFVGSDRYPIVIIEVMTNKKIKVAPMYNDDYKKHIYEENGIQYVKASYMDGYNKDNSFTYTYRKNKRWMPMGQDMWGTSAIHLGYADSYLDPCF